MIKTVPDAANLDWAIGLGVLFVIVFISLLRTRTTGAFRRRILLLAADLAGIVYFVSGEYAAIAAAVLGLIFWSWTSRGVTRTARKSTEDTVIRQKVRR